MAEFPSAIGVGATLSSNSKANDSLDRQGLQTITMVTETAFEVHLKCCLSRPSSPVAIALRRLWFLGYRMSKNSETPNLADVRSRSVRCGSSASLRAMFEVSFNLPESTKP